MTLKQYIESLGDKVAAKKLGEKERTVRSWRYGERFPMRNKAVSIVKKTGGMVSLAEIYG